MLAVADDSPCQSLADLTGPTGRCGCSTEYPELTRRALAAAGVEAEISLSYGATEAKVPEIADCVVEITETGRALRAAGLRIIDTLLVSYTELIANPASAADPEKRHAMEQILHAAQGTLEAREKVLVKLNVAERALEAVIGRAAVAAVARRSRSCPATAATRSRRWCPRPRSTPSSPRSKDAGRHRHPRAGPRQDRPLMARLGPRRTVAARRGVVRAFDDDGGSGRSPTSDGTDFAFHCTAIADGIAADRGRAPGGRSGRGRPATWGGIEARSS